MENVTIITTGNNKTKVDAIKNVLAKLPIAGFYFSPLIIEQAARIPLSTSDLTQALTEKTEKLFKEYKPEIKASVIYAVEIQMGVNVKDNDPLKLICGVSIIAKDESKISIATNSIDLPEEIRTLVIEEKIELYDAYGKVYGEKIRNKELSLYEHLTQKTQASWFEETVFKAFIF